MKLKLFWWKIVTASAPVPITVSPNGGQNGQKRGAKNSTVMRPIQMSAVHPTSCEYPRRFHGPGSKSGLRRRR